MYTYSWHQWLAFFYIYCVCGWIFESTYVSLKEKHFINRGFLRLPMLPLYGTGAVMMLWVSLPFRDNLILVYLSGMIAATILEYITGYMMERLFKVRYWDYSNQKFQLHSYICLSSSVAWGFLTILMTEVIHQPVSDLVLSLNPVFLMACLFVASFIFAADAYQSTKTALALGKKLEAMTKLRQEIEELQQKMIAIKKETALYMADIKEETAQIIMERKEETGQRFSEFKEETAQFLMDIKEETSQILAETREAAEQKIAGFKEETLQKITGKNLERQDLVLLLQHLQTLSEKYSALSRHHSYYLKSLLKRNPKAASSKFSQALKELREGLKESEKEKK